MTSDDGLEFIIQECHQARGDTGEVRSIDKLCKASCILKFESVPIRLLRRSSAVHEKSSQPLEFYLNCSDFWIKLEDTFKQVDGGLCFIN